ncbi:MAG: DUF4260 domain-containing protein [Melioribacteraceae bacterium]|nr:DUF4260 domain-containing protein [Melioribacteraceae bacterium]MCF8353696.1 DUF4260 domain-containing protein [Melioribacteraceae bacterium]MCF8396074.1 DUF4260 domain-containing protein [Melioribacteraceae bacterium]MCF8418612.1 DUF4260 domain-containing protein [Melioribacteraceae bacterium]
MKKLIQVEEIFLFLFSIYLFTLEDFAWWVFPLFLLAPDIAMIGYLKNTKVGAVVYNLFHHRAISIALYITGVYLISPYLRLIAIILFAHSSIDRVFGFGLKYFDDFKHTHLDES